MKNLTDPEVLDLFFAIYPSAGEHRTPRSDQFHLQTARMILSAPTLPEAAKTVGVVNRVEMGPIRKLRALAGIDDDGALIARMVVAGFEAENKVIQDRGWHPRVEIFADLSPTDRMLRIAAAQAQLQLVREEEAL